PFGQIPANEKEKVAAVDKLLRDNSILYAAYRTEWPPYYGDRTKCWTSTKQSCDKYSCTHLLSYDIIGKIKNGQHVSGWEERKTIIKYHTGYNRDQAVVSSEIPDKEQLRLGLIGIFVVIHATNNCFVLCVRVKKGEKAQCALWVLPEILNEEMNECYMPFIAQCMKEGARVYVYNKSECKNKDSSG
ncbi:hypothetical protein MTO96_020136, partial [Rhipicephalus appendiculatus]